MTYMTDSDKLYATSKQYKFIVWNFLKKASATKSRSVEFYSNLKGVILLLCNTKYAIRKK